MSLNPDFKSIEDFYKSENKPLSSKDLQVNSGGQLDTAVINPNATPIKIQNNLKENEKPGFFKTLGEGFKETNTFAQAGSYLSRELEFAHPYDDEVPADFDRYNIDNFTGVPPAYWGFVAEASGPKEMEARKQWAAEHQQHMEDMENGSMMAQIIGGITGALLSPDALIPLSIGSKSLRLTTAIIQDVAKAAPTVAAQSLVHEGFNEATKASSNIDEFIVNTARDMLFSSAFIAGGAGLGAKLRGGDLWSARKVVSDFYEGIDAHPIINEKGEVTGFKAVDIDGSVSAQKVQQAQQFLDYGMQRSALVKLPFMKTIIANKITGSPIVRGLTSDYGIIRYMTDRLSENTIITEAVARGEAKATSAETMMKYYQAMGAQFTASYKGHFYEQNGIEGGYNFTNAAKTFAQKANGGQQMSEQAFNAAVAKQILTQQYISSKSINAVSKEAGDTMDYVWKRYVEINGLDERMFNRDAMGYITYSYTEQVRIEGGLFEQIGVEDIRSQDELLTELLTPYDTAKAHLKQLEEAKFEAPEDTRALAFEIKAARARLKDIERDIENKVLADGSQYRIMLEDHNFLTYDEAAELKELMQPRTDALREAEKREAQIGKLQAQLSKTKSKAKANLTQEATKKNVAKMKEIEADILRLRNEAGDLQRMAEDHLTNLEERALNGEINKKFYSGNEEGIKFKEPVGGPKFRERFKSDDERLAWVKNFRERILHMTDEQVADDMMRMVSPSQFGSPLMTRTAMIRPTSLLEKINDVEGGFLDVNVPRMVNRYLKVVGRHVAIHDAMPDLLRQGSETIEQALGRNLAEEHRKNLLEIDKKTYKKKEDRYKAIQKEQKKFEEAKEFMGNMLSTHYGRTNYNPTASKWARFFRQWAATTKLGGTAIAMITDLGANVLKHNMYPYLTKGLAPMLRSMNGYLKTQQSEEFIQVSKNALLGIEHTKDAYSKFFFDAPTMGRVPTSAKLEGGMEYMTNLSSKLFFIDQFENLNQRTTANLMDGEIIRLLKKYQKQGLSQSDTEKLLVYGLDPKEWADRFVKNYDVHKSEYSSRYWDWSDIEASNKMAETIRRGVYDTIVQSGAYTSPFWSKNPFASLVLMFHGWAFAAFTRYTVPMLQRPQANKLFGIITMLSLGLLSEGIRNFANGKEFKFTEDDDTWFDKSFMAVANSGVLGQYSDVVQIANKLLDSPLPTSVRYQGINKLGAMQGPVLGMGDDFLNAVIQLGRGDFNKKDIKKTIRLAPLSSMLGVRYLTNTYIDSLDLPETRTEARQARGG